MGVKADLRVILGLDKAGFDKSLASATASVNRFSRQTAAAKKNIGGMLGGAGLGSLAKFGGYAAAFTALGKAFGDCAANGRALETSMAHLQSLTGLSSDVMGRVKQMATDTGMAMGIASSQIVDSYGVIGSKMPELLKSPEALDDIARSAATLAKAGVMPLEASIESLTGIMNQMGASADQADTYINVLAAGSKNGAGNIEYLATAFTKAGSAIRNAGLSVQEGTALIEALAKRMPDAAEAGTALRNVLLVLGTTAGDELNPKVVGLEKALENLHARMGDTNEMVKLFGKRNYNAAAILADSTEQVKNLTEAVTGTSEAHLQAEVNGKTLDAQLNRLSASWETLTAAIGESNGFLQSFISLINQALQGWAQWMRDTKETRIADQGSASKKNARQTADQRVDYWSKVTDTNRLTMKWRGKTIVDLSRDFINTNGVRQKTEAIVNAIPDNVLEGQPVTGATMQEKMLSMLANPNVASQKGLIEMFDATIGATTVLMPFGGKRQLTETQASVQKLPVLHGHTNTASVMAFGYNPYIALRSPFHAAVFAILESMSKIVATGADYKGIRFTFQEYFEKMGHEPTRWGKPCAAMLGCVWMLKQFDLAALGGKDSMSGTFKNLHVPPTFVSFAITTENAKNIISPEFKKEGHYLYFIQNKIENNLPDIQQTKKIFDFVHQNTLNGNIVAAFTPQYGGIAEALAKMSFGNDLGFDIRTDLNLFDYAYGCFVVETTEKLDADFAVELGKVSKDFIINGEKIDKEACLKVWRGVYFNLYPDQADNETQSTGAEFAVNSQCAPVAKCPTPVARPKVILPVFPGTNCDYDTAKAFEDAGAEPRIFVFNNLNETEINRSIDELAAAIDESQIMALSGGFSSGDEPDGSGKFIATVLNNAKIKAAVNGLLARKGLVLGICNGFQALVKSGLLPYGRLGDITPESPTLYRNNINRHISRIVRTRVGTVASPWLTSFQVGDVHQIAVSHGEGKFVVNEKLAKELFEHGQVAFQYCDENGNVSMNPVDNPNGSFYAIEGIVSQDGLILGKMGHSERKGENLYKNIDGNKEQDIFQNAVNYFRQ